MGKSAQMTGKMRKCRDTAAPSEEKHNWGYRRPPAHRRGKGNGVPRHPVQTLLVRKCMPIGVSFFVIFCLFFVFFCLFLSFCCHVVTFVVMFCHFVPVVCHCVSCCVIVCHVWSFMCHFLSCFVIFCHLLSICVICCLCLSCVCHCLSLCVICCQFGVILCHLLSLFVIFCHFVAILCLFWCHFLSFCVQNMGYDAQNNGKKCANDGENAQMPRHAAPNEEKHNWGSGDQKRIAGGKETVFPSPRANAAGAKMHALAGYSLLKVNHTFSAFWLRSSVVSVLISLISDIEALPLRY